MREGVLLVRVPPGRRALAQIELLLHAQKKALVPLVGRRLCAQLREIDDGGNDTLLRELLGGTVHQARLAHLPRRQDVGEVAGETVAEQFAVRVALHIDAAPSLNGASSDEHESVSHRF